MNITTLIMEIIVWCRLAFSPLLLGLILAGIAYLGLPDVYGLIVAAIIILLAIYAGIRMANSFKTMQQEMNPDAVKNIDDEN